VAVLLDREGGYVRSSDAVDEEDGEDGERGFGAEGDGQATEGDAAQEDEGSVAATLMTGRRRNRTERAVATRQCEMPRHATSLSPRSSVGD
jgi:hypothetical protein